VARHYARIGGRSPLNELTLRQAAGLQAELAREGVALPVFVGMRNWHPFLHETLAEMKDKGHRRALGIILSSFQTEASWERYIVDVLVARRKVGDRVYLDGRSDEIRLPMIGVLFRPREDAVIVEQMMLAEAGSRDGVPLDGAR
jgi:hypothetical protein